VDISNWKTQLRKGFLEYGLLHAVRARRRAYGLEIIEATRSAGLPLTEGTLYPLISRLNKEGLLKAEWETESMSGHPRKYYLLTPVGHRVLKAMDAEWNNLLKTIHDLRGDTR
jgi:PadR family transcriptional regulator PadR